MLAEGWRAPRAFAVCGSALTSQHYFWDPAGTPALTTHADCLHTGGGEQHGEMRQCKQTHVLCDRWHHALMKYFLLLLTSSIRCCLLLSHLAFKGCNMQPFLHVSLTSKFMFCALAWVLNAILYLRGILPKMLPTFCPAKKLPILTAARRIGSRRFR